MKQDRIDGFHKISHRCLRTKQFLDAREDATGRENSKISEEIRRLIVVALALIDQSDEKFPEKYA